MYFTTRDEIEYLDSIDGEDGNPQFVHEMQQRLDALRRYDQNYSASDWHPRSAGSRSRRDSPLRAL